MSAFLHNYVQVILAVWLSLVVIFKALNLYIHIYFVYVFCIMFVFTFKLLVQCNLN